MATLQSSQNLVLLDTISYSGYQINEELTRVYMTEGPRTPSYPNFMASIEVVLESGKAAFDNAPILNSTVTACSISTTIKSAVASSKEAWVNAKFVEYTNY